MSNSWGSLHIDLFEQLILRSDEVQELWRPQADALREWHDRRDTSDILFKLNTGAGKTLVGLLAAQSLVNETQQRVLYACATNQLLEQTAEKAAQYGINVATYYRGKWVAEERYTQSTGPLLTNYHAIFNGRSIFARDELAPAACVFDDAHTAQSVVRDQFTLRVARDAEPALYTDLVQHLAPYFSDSGRGMIYRDVVNQRDPDSVLFVPLFVSAPLSDTFRDLLQAHDSFLNDGSGRFVWPHLRHHLQHCAVLFSHRRIGFTPLVPPVHMLRIFGSSVRRLYLSATLRVGENFCRTFGRYPEHSIEPGGRAGDTERMILPAPRELTEAAAVDWVRRMIHDHKALVMVPSARIAASWSDIGDVFYSEAGHVRIQQFAHSDNEKLILVARYDGIDLPGNACRTLVVDGLPLGVSRFDRFLESHLDLKGITSDIVASRFAQLLGRISRGMTDYGVFFLVGRRLLRWLDAPTNRSLLPLHIRRQLELGHVLAEGYSKMSPEGLALRCLNREEEWLAAYTEYMKGVDNSVPAAVENATGPTLAEAEVAFVRCLWEGQPDKAARKLRTVRAAARREGKAFAAWQLHWTAHALSRVDADDARAKYGDAGRMCVDLGRPPRELEVQEAESTLQSQRMADLLNARGLPRMLRELSDVAGRLVQDSASAAEHEEAVRLLGELLGFNATRPDNDGDGGEGPDVLWTTPDNAQLFLIELKTKKESAVYNKKDVGQIHNHCQWASNEFPDIDSVRLLIGPRLQCSAAASPPDDFWIVTPDEVDRLRRAVVEVYERAASEQFKLLMPAAVASCLEQLHLRWETIIDNLEKVRLGQFMER